MTWSGLVGEGLAGLFTAIGAVVAVGGGVAGIAFGLFKFFGERWLNAKFEERLAAYKHAQQQELERLKLKINTLMDRTTKLHQREFDVIPEVWSKLADANAEVLAFVSPAQQYSDVSRMNERQLEEFLEQSDLTEWQKDELRASADRKERYIKFVFWHRRDKVRSTLREFHIYLKKNGIFVPDPLRSNFMKMDNLLWEALAEHEDNEELNLRPRDRARRDALDKNGPDILSAIEGDVRSRLWSSHVTDI